MSGSTSGVATTVLSGPAGEVPIGDELPAGDSKRAWPADVEALATYKNLRLFSVETSEDVGPPAD